MRILLTSFFFLFTFSVVAQVTPQDQTVVEKDSIAAVADPHYREDQIYASIAYNLLQNKPAGFSQYSLSTNLTVGILRDIPLNAARNRAIAIGVGYSYNNLKQNLLIDQLSNQRYYYVDTEGGYDKNKLVLHYVEVPLEFRWRNSDSISHKFWRVYGGLKASYLFASKSQYEMAGSKMTIRRNDDLNKFIFGAYLAAGWNTWNLYAYYGFNPIFKSAVLDNGDKVKLTSLNLGLMFYIL